jgi:hypothetical protein
MAKKSRSRKRTKTPRLSAAQLVQPGEEERPKTLRALKQPRGKPLTELGEEYRYVVNDLKRIAIIAIAMMAVMIVLAVLLV